MRYLILTLLLFVVFVWTLTLGRYEISYDDILELVLYKVGALDELEERLTHAEFILFNTRLPRAILAVFVGMALGVSGASFQAIFKNPLASPDILGVMSGAAFGAVLALWLGLNIYLITTLSFGFGVITLILTLIIAKGASNHIMVILAGIIVSALFQSFISLIKYIADPQDTLPAITYWLLGSLQVSNIQQMIICCAVISLSVYILFLYRWKHNLLMLDDNEAKSLGLNVVRLRILLILSSTLMISCVVSLCGIISWVGLIIPHISRLICGSNNSQVIPTSIFMGAIFMLCIDTLSRALLSQELPISILSAVLGALIFLIILYKFRGARL